ncbi:MAG: discoidin domain-containing protein [Verrucomicrobia bacterium]|nr:discoidin domain-containing protein [Verrucomicrobiota bacterium]
MTLPLPKGEGWGEGEQGVRLPACSYVANPRRSSLSLAVEASIGSLVALFCLGVLLALCSVPAHASSSNSTAWRQLIEADWLGYEESLVATNRAALLTCHDAAGGCDGVKDGGYGFHTDKQDQPWWQVDLGSPQPLARVVIWNRLECPERAAWLQVKLSDDGHDWRTGYHHDGSLFYGSRENRPLTVQLTNQAARFVRIQLPGNDFLHLEEVEVFGPADGARNLALHRPADQSSLSAWSQPHALEGGPVVDWARRTKDVLAFCDRLLAELPKQGSALTPAEQSSLKERLAALRALSASRYRQETYLEARWLQRRLALANPLLDFESILVTKRVPGSFNHMSDQYYGWWSRPGGGIYLLKRFKTEEPVLECLTDAFHEAGSFLRPALSYDARKVLFAWCKHYPQLAAETNKLNKANVPEDAFYHLFEMNIDGSGVRQLTRGKYDDFDGRYLPDGRIVLLSTRRGQFIQAGRESAGKTLAQADLPDCYVRCGGGPERPVAVYTLHVMERDGTGLCAISPFEMFEWEPSVANDGGILYARWDYIDRDNMPYMSLWTTRPDGTGTRMIYKNFTRIPHCVFEPRSIPNSDKIIFTASGHHSQTMGSLVRLDPGAGTEGADPITRLTPEVCFPEAEGWPLSSYATPWPLSERCYLVSWGMLGAKHPGPAGWARWHAVPDQIKEMGLCWFDADGQLEPLYRDPEMSTMYPIPVRPQPLPPVLAAQAKPEGTQEGRFLLADVYRGLGQVKRGDIKRLRLVAVPPKTHPTMNFPKMGLTADDPGKCVLGTVPVEADGSAWFRAPSGVTLFFQALDAQGLAVQTMRSATYAQPGETVGCIGCHESRNQTASASPVLASLHEPSRITPGPEGSWPLRFDRLIQPVLDQHCVSCHAPGVKDARAAKFDLTPAKSYDTLVRYGKPSLLDQVQQGYRQGFSKPGEGLAATSALLALLSSTEGHYQVKLDPGARERFTVWMDTYAQRFGSFSADQERRLEDLRRSCADLLTEPAPPAHAAAEERALRTASVEGRH